MSSAIIVSNLYKSYKDNLVLKDVSFSVDKGEVFALLGANGAGKTTTLECIEGIRPYESGQIKIDGSVGVQLQSTSLNPNMGVSEALSLFAKWQKSKVDMEFCFNGK